MNTAIQHDMLNKFVGCWNTTGIIAATDMHGDIYISGTDIYEWLPGDFFLLHKASVLIGEDRSETFEIMGVDSEANVFTMQYYNNKGESGFMTATCTDDVWIFSGEALKFTGGFNYNNNEFSGTWEQCDKDENWIPFMKIKLIKSE